MAHLLRAWLIARLLSVVLGALRGHAVLDFEPASA
jgi:hypothetical protein